MADKSKQALKEISEQSDSAINEESPSVELIEQELDRLSAQAHTVTATMTLMSGPLPPPNILAQYADISPDLLDWIKEHTAKEQDSRIANTKSASRFQFFSLFGSVFILSLSIVCGVILAYVSHPIHGLILAASGAFVSAIGAITRLIRVLKNPSNEVQSHKD